MCVDSVVTRLGTGWDSFLSRSTWRLAVGCTSLLFRGCRR